MYMIEMKPRGMALNELPFHFISFLFDFVLLVIFMGVEWEANALNLK